MSDDDCDFDADDLEGDDLDDEDFEGEFLHEAPVYLVRWPNLSACLVRAHNEQHLKLMLDEIDDPGACQWQIYTGPIWFELDLPVKLEVHDDGSGKPTSRADLRLEGVEALLAEGYQLTPSIPEGDTGEEMHNAILSATFPATYAKLQEWCSKREDPEAKAPGKVVAGVREALLDDLRLFLETSWRWQQVARRAAQGDPQAVRMQLMGLTEDIYGDDPDD